MGRRDVPGRARIGPCCTRYHWDGTVALGKATSVARMGPWGAWDRSVLHQALPGCNRTAPGMGRVGLCLWKGMVLCGVGEHQARPGSDPAQASAWRRSHLELPPGVELFQTLDCLLPVHHGGHSGALLQGTRGISARCRWPQGRGTHTGAGGRRGDTALTQTHGCLRASWAVMRLAGLMVSIWLMRFFASGVTVSHSGEGNWGGDGTHGAGEGQPHSAHVPPPPHMSPTSHGRHGPKPSPRLCLVVTSCSIPQ